MGTIASAPQIVAELRILNCSSADIAQYVEISVDFVEHLIAGTLTHVNSRAQRRLERLHRLVKARSYVAELMLLGVREREIAEKIGASKETITHIHRDPYWSVGVDLLDRLRTTLFKRRLELFERLLPQLEIQPFQTSGRPTNRPGWTRRAERIRGALLKAYGASPIALRGRDFEGIIATLGGGEMILIWARDAHTLLHEAKHLVAFAQQMVKRNRKPRTKDKDLMRICK
jgi:hypothetical protein